jgi:hypothetical protein
MFSVCLSLFKQTSNSYLGMQVLADCDQQYHHVCSSSIVLSGLHDGSPLCSSQTLPIDGSRPVTDASFGSGMDGGVDSRGSSAQGSYTPTSKVDLFSDQTAGLPSPLMKLTELPLSNGTGTPTSFRHRERTPPPTQRGHSQSFSRSTEHEIIGDIIPDTDLALFPSVRLRSYTDEEQSSCVATTTGTSFGRMTAHTTTTHSTKSDNIGGMCYERGSSLLDSQQLSSSAREMVALDVPSLVPNRQHHPPIPQRPTSSLSVLTQVVTASQSRAPNLSNIHSRW